MITLLDVVRREKEKMNLIIDSRKEIFEDVLRSVDSIDEIVFIGSGSSYSSVLSTSLIVEKLSGIKTYTMFPNLFINKSVFNKNALYILVSQTGTSRLMIELAKTLKEKGIKTAAICSDKESPLVKNTDVLIDLRIGYEEYSYATLGFTCSMLTEILFGLEFGLKTNYLSNDKYNEYLEELKKTPDSNSEVIDNTIKWFDNNKNNLLKHDNFILFGGSTLYGIASEGALKIMEITKKYVSIGYEMDDGMHGPNYCFDERTGVIVLNDGKEDRNAKDLMNLMKKEYDSGYMVGINTMDAKDLLIDFKTNEFTNLEIITFVQTFAYLLAVENKIDIFEKKDPRNDEIKGKGYFDMHDIK